MLFDQIGRSILELAQAIGLKGLVGRMGGSRGIHEFGLRLRVRGTDDGSIVHYGKKGGSFPQPAAKMRDFSIKSSIFSHISRASGRKSFPGSLIGQFQRFLPWAFVPSMNGFPVPSSDCLHSGRDRPYDPPNKNTNGLDTRLGSRVGDGRSLLDFALNGHGVLTRLSQSWMVMSTTRSLIHSNRSRSSIALTVFRVVSSGVSKRTPPRRRSNRCAR